MKKIIVIGCPGAGKSCFSRELHKKTDLPLYHLDMIWHKPDRTTVSKEEFDEKLTEIMQRDEWIIDGNYSRTLEMRLRKCDTVFFLDLPIDLCLKGAESRIGTQREDLPWLEETMDPEFRQWIIDFPKNKLPRLYELAEKYKDTRNITVFHTREEVNDYIKELK